MLCFSFFLCSSFVSGVFFSEIVMSILFLLMIITVFILFLIQFIFSSLALVSDPQFSSLESGFESLNYTTYMSSSFFLLAVLFVLFDMELILLFPILFFLSISISSFFAFVFLVLFIIVTLLVEWSVYGLKWFS